MKILVADDDSTLRNGLAEILREDGHDVTLAADGREAIRLIERESFDVALLDLMMPKATGLDVLNRLRVVRPETAAVMVTGQGTIDTAVEAMKAGAIDFVEKPYDVDALQRTLKTVAEEREARASLGATRGTDAETERVLTDAASRKALLAVLGPNAKPPVGASRVLRISDEARTPDTFTPSQMYQLNGAIEEYIRAVDRPVVLAAEIGMLESVHGRDDMKAWIRHMSGRCGAKGGSLVLRGLPPDLATSVAEEAEAGEPSAGLQSMLESLANPIRRAVVSYVYTSGPVAYSAILKKSFVDSSSKLSFHLQKLQTDGLLTKVEAGRYAVTEAGSRAWQVVRTLADHRGPSFLVSRA